MDCGQEPKPVTGSGDRSVRLWKVDSGSHLVFRKHSAPIDCVRHYEGRKFLSGGQDGGINVWSDQFRGPIASQIAAHKVDLNNYPR